MHTVDKRARGLSNGGKRRRLANASKNGSNEQHGSAPCLAAKEMPNPQIIATGFHPRYRSRPVGFARVRSSTCMNSRARSTQETTPLGAGWPATVELNADNTASANVSA